MIFIIIRMWIILWIRFINELTSKICRWLIDKLESPKRVIRFFGFLSQLLLKLSSLLILLYLIHIVLFPFWLKAISFNIAWMIQLSSNLIFIRLFILFCWWVFFLYFLVQLIFFSIKFIYTVSYFIKDEGLDSFII